MALRRAAIAAALLTLAASPAGAGAAAGWLQAPTLAADGELRGAGVRGDGVAQVVFGAGGSELAVQRPFDRAWQAPVASELPAGLSTVVQNANGDRIGWARTPGGELVVSSLGTSSRRDDGSWSAPLVLATGVRAGGAVVVLGDNREAIAAWVATDGAVVARFRGRFGAWGGPVRLDPPGATAGGPVLTLNESGDALVAWVRGAPGARRIRVAPRQASLVKADRPFSRTATVPGAAGDPILQAAALSLTGDGTLAWIEGPPGGGPLRTSNHSSGAGAWTRPATVVPRALGGRVGVAAAGGAVIAWTDTGGVGVAQRAAGVAAWSRVAGPPPPAARLLDMVVTRLGDVALATTNIASDDLVVVRRAAGSRTWTRAPLTPGAGLTAPTALLAAARGGDLVAAWSYRAATGMAPVHAASYRAPDLPGVTALAAHPARVPRGATTRVTFRLSARGRVIVSLRRPFGGRVLAAFAVQGRRGANSVLVPRPAIARLLGPGRYVILADTSARRLGVASTIIRTTP